MIKKINIALAGAFVVLFLLKIIVSMVGGARANRSVNVATTEIAVRNAEIAPNVYFMVFAPYFWPNPLTNRNGYVNDLMAAIFPRAKFVQLNMTTQVGFLDKLQNDPHAVVVYGGHRVLMDFPHSDIPVVDIDLCLTTLRTNEWRYDGLESLEKIRIGLCADDVSDSHVLLDYSRKFKDDPARLKIYPSTVTAEILNRDLDSGAIDAYVSVLLPSRFVLNSSNARTLARYRNSERVDSIPLRAFVSNADPDWSAAFLEAFARGMKEIEESGELRRIREYYGFEGN